VGARALYIYIHIYIYIYKLAYSNELKNIKVKERNMHSFYCDEESDGFLFLFYQGNKAVYLSKSVVGK